MAQDQDYTGQRALRPGEAILSSAPNADTIATAESRAYARGVEDSLKAVNALVIECKESDRLRDSVGAAGVAQEAVDRIRALTSTPAPGDGMK